MDWNEILTQVILYVIGGVFTLLGGVVTWWISTKVKDEKLKKILNGALEVVSDGVDYVYQTFVQSLKGTDLWDEKAMKEACDKAVEYINKNLSQEALKYLTENGKDIQEWIKEQIEIAIKKSKDCNSNNSTKEKEC